MKYAETIVDLGSNVGGSILYFASRYPAARIYGVELDPETCRKLQANVALLAELDDITLEELLEARRLLEVPAARLAARRRSVDDVDRLRDAIPDEATGHGAGERFSANAGFHTSVMAASGNALLEVAALPVFAVLQTSLARSGLGPRFARRIDADHQGIADAIGRGDGDGAAEAMEAHLAYLQPHYRRVWRLGRGRRA